MVAKQVPWHPITESDAKRDPDPRSKPIDFTLTPAERDIARLAMVDVMANLRRSQFGQPEARGLEVRELSPCELTKSEQMALGVRGGVR
jgi:hypothetical protein